MKLLAIRGRNLASLPRFSVRFDSEPLRRAGVFLISGPTGAGKSTLLDAMCLALYDKTPRLVSGEFDKGLKVGYQDDSIDLRLPAGDPRSLLRRGAVIAWAQVEFQIRGKGRFQSTWSVRRARYQPDGRMQEVRIDLRDLDRDRTISSDRKTETLKLIEELIGLSFPQFCRSVLLAQGEFAQFLRLRGDERADLLEKMTGTGIYAQLSRRAHERALAETARWQELQDQRAAQHALRDPERAALQAQALALSVERERLAADSERLRRAERLHQERARLSEECAQAERALQTVEGGSAAADELRLRMAALAAAQVLRPVYDEATRAAAEQALVAEQAGRAGQRRQLAHTAQGSAQAAALHADQALRATRLGQEQVAPLLTRARELDLRAQAAEETLTAATRTAGEAARALAQRRAAIAQKEKQAIQLGESLAVLAQWLEEHGGVAPLLPTWSQSQGALAQYREELTEAHKRDKRKAALERQREQARRRFAELQQALVAPRQALAVHTAALGERRQALEAQRLRHPPPQVRAAREAAAAALATLDRLEDLMRHGLRLRQREQELVARREHHEREAQHKALLRSQATTRLVELEAAERQGTRDLQVAREAEKLAARRPELLTEGQPCPLCGSREHPAAAEHAPLGALTARLAAELLVLSREVAATREQRQKADTAAHAAARLLEQAEQELRTLAVERQEREGQFAQLATRLPGPRPGELALFALATAGQLQDLRQRFTAQQHQAQAAESAAAALQQAAEEAQRLLDEARLQVERLSEEQSVCGKALQEAEAALLGVVDLLEQGRLARSRLTELLAEPLRELPGWAERLASDPLGYLQWLESEVAAYGQHAAQREQAAGRAQELAGALLLLRGEIDRLAGEHQTLAAAQQRAAAARDALLTERRSLPEPLGRRPVAEVEEEQRGALARAERAAQEAQRRLQEAAAELAHAEGAARSLEERLLAAQSAAAQSGARLAAALRDFRAPAPQAEEPASAPTAEELQALLRMDERERQRLQRELAAFDEARAAAVGTLRDRRARQEQGEAALRDFLQAAAPAPIEVLSAAGSVAAALAATAARHAVVSEEYGAAAGRLREDDRLRERTVSLIPAIEAQRAVSERWAELSGLIGSADGKRFRKFAQGLTLDALLGYANQHLSRLRPRYRLERVPGFDMDLQIIDRELGDEVRSCATLSGGETFLASLALALGLSALSAQSVPLESLFIDEGFGTLDDEALVQALDMLEELHGEGRQVGVISHVHDLTERISHQIVVEPRPPGQSRVYLRDGERTYESDDDEDDPADLALPAPKKAAAPRARKGAPRAARPAE